MQPPTPRSVSDMSRASFAQPVILIGGSVRAAATSARRGGFVVTGVDRFADTDTLAACEQHVLIDRAASGIAAVDRLPPTPVVSVGGLSDAERWIGRLARRHPILGLSLAAIRELRGPHQLQRLAEGTGLAFPPWWLDEPGGRGPGAHPKPQGGVVANTLGAPSRWLWKDADSSGGLGVRWAPERLGATVGNHRAGYFQQWIPGRPYGATFLGDGTSARLLGVCRLAFSRIGKLPFVYAGAGGPIFVPASHLDAVRQFGHRCAQAQQLRGLFNVDFLVDAQGQRWLLEVNPRWSASSELIESFWREQTEGKGPTEATRESSLFRIHWEFLCGLRRWEDDGAPSSGLGTTKGGSWWWKRVVFSVRSGRFHRRLLDEPPSPRTAVEPRFTDLPADGHPIRRGEPIATVRCRIAAGSRIAPVELKRLVRQVRQAVS